MLNVSCRKYTNIYFFGLIFCSIMDELQSSEASAFVVEGEVEPLVSKARDICGSIF